MKTIAIYHLIEWIINSFQRVNDHNYVRLLSLSELTNLKPRGLFKLYPWYKAVNRAKSFCSHNVLSNVRRKNLGSRLLPCLDTYSYLQNLGHKLNSPVCFNINWLGVNLLDYNFYCFNLLRLVGLHMYGSRLINTCISMIYY